MEKMGTVYPPSAVEFMELALEQARFAFDNLEVPIGCVIVENDKVIASGSNRTTETRNATRHAEMEAIDFLLDKWQKDGLKQMQVAEKFSRCDLYVTCEPCIMCATALSILGIREVYYGCANDKFGGCGSILSLHQTDSEKMFREGSIQGKGFKCTGGLMSTEAVALLRSFYEQGNPNGPLIELADPLISLRNYSVVFGDVGAWEEYLRTKEALETGSNYTILENDFFAAPKPHRPVRVSQQ